MVAPLLRQGESVIRIMYRAVGTEMLPDKQVVAAHERLALMLWLY